jgi:signal transduction histidine kinase/sensor domain CHASE-containing protein
MNGGRNRLPVRLVPWLVLASSVLLTVAAALFVLLGTRARDTARFDNAVQAAHDRVIGRLDIYISTLRGGAALFAASEDVSPEEFRSYVQRLEIQERYPGIQGVGFTQRVEYDPSGGNGERHAIVYLEPMDERNRAAIGFDMYSEPTRRAAMDLARDLGDPAMSGPVTLVQEIYEHDEQRGFLIYVPVYRNGSVPETVEARRAELLGFVYAPFRVDDLFAGIFGSEERPRVSLAVFDTPGDNAAPALIHRSPREPGYEPRFSSRAPLEVAGRAWTVEYVSQPAFEAGSGRRIVPPVILAGLLFSGWLFWLAWRLTEERMAADEANRAKSAFLATMSHELRTPLNAIAGYVDLMQLGIPDAVSPGQQEYLERIQRAQQHLLGLINDVLNFAKLEAGRVEYQHDRVAVGPLVEEAVEMMLPAASSRGLTCTLTPGPDVRALGDAEKMRQVLLNLLSNAIKFTVSGGTVGVTWHRTGDRVNIEVSDTGMGIDPEHQERIFDPFVQVDSDLTREKQGTGLGLSISRALARGMDGEVTVESRRGAGSTFTFSLPAPAAEVREVRTAVPAEAD